MKKYIGMIVDLNFLEHFGCKISKANTKRAYSQNFSYIDKEIFLSVYKSLVRLHLQYVRAAWVPLFKNMMHLKMPSIGQHS